VTVRLTPDIPRGFSQEEAEATVRMAARFRDRGVVAIGLGGLEKEYPPGPYAPAFRLARELGNQIRILHGADTVPQAIRAKRIQRAPDRGRSDHLAGVRHRPEPELAVLCTLNTDDPAFFGTDLGNEHAAAARLGLSPRAFYEAGVAGALCDDATRARLRAIGDAFDWGGGRVGGGGADPAQPLTAPPVMPRTK